MPPEPAAETRRATPPRPGGLAGGVPVAVAALVAGVLAALLTESSLVRQLLVGAAVTALVVVSTAASSMALRRRPPEGETRAAGELAGRSGDAAVTDELWASIARGAHDLRTPLNTLAGMVDTLIRHGEALPADQRRELLEATQRSTRRIASWITMLLDTATDRAPSPPTNVATPVRPLLDEAAMISTAATTGLDVRVAPTRLQVAADPSAVVRVVSNLLANAGHHANATTVTVEALRAGRSVQVQIRDDGDGWETAGADAPDAAAHRHAGHGLGLASVRSQVAAWGGKLELDDTPGGGATIRFTLPLGDGEDAGARGGTEWTIAGDRSVVRGVRRVPPQT